MVHFPKGTVLNPKKDGTKRERKKAMKVIVAAAGTAGHINPAISIANKIKQEQPDSKIVFIRNNQRIRK